MFPIVVSRWCWTGLLNPGVSICVCRSTDIDMILSESAFNDVKMSRARFLTNPGWYVSSYSDRFLETNVKNVFQLGEMSRLLSIFQQCCVFSGGFSVFYGTY